MKLREIVQYTPPDSRTSRQRRLLHLLVGFLVVMAALAVLSRAADSLTVAQVTANSPKSGAISHAIEKEGVLEAKRQVPVLAAQGALVESVKADTGALLKAGEPIFTLNMADLQRQIAIKNLERQKLLLERSEAARIIEEEKNGSSQGMDRAEEDSQNSSADAQTALRRARQDLKLAQDNISRFWRVHDKDDFRSYRDSRDDDFWRDDNDYTSIGYSESDIPAARTELDNLEKAYEQAKRDLSDAERLRERALLDAQRKVDDAKKSDPSTYRLQSLALDIQQKDIELEDLWAALANEGQVLSPVDGVIHKLDVSTGSRTGNTAGAVVAETAGGCRFRATLDEEEAKYIARGSEIEIITGKDNRSGVKATVDSMVTTPAGTEITAWLSEGEIGQRARMQTSQRGESYPLTLPLSALRGGENDRHVLIITERETVLGVEQVAERMDVTVLDSNESTAAVSGPLSSSDKVIESSSKSIVAGDRVRPAVS